MYEVRPGRVFTGARCGGGWGGALTNRPFLVHDRAGSHGPLLVRARAARWNSQDVMAPNWGRTGVLGTVEVGARVHDGPGWKCVSPFFESRPGGRSALYERHEDVEPPGDEQEVLVRNPPALCRSSPTCIDFYVVRNQNFSVRPGMQKSVVLKG